MRWTASTPYTVGLEEEVMLVDPHDGSLAQSSDEVLPDLAPALGARFTAETHQAIVELATAPHAEVSEAIAEVQHLRHGLAGELSRRRLCAASAGTHPFALWLETEVSGQRRYQLLHESMRELARREPTCALHVHVGVADPEDAMWLMARMRTHLPLLLALSANSPFWQGRDTGLASARTPIFQAFPRVGIPRPFARYADWVDTVRLLIATGAIPDPSFLWWDIRPQPSLGTIEIRIMDAQTTVAETAALAALVQAIARLELEERPPPWRESWPEVLEENRFIAARDGLEAELIDPVRERRVPALTMLEELRAAARPHAEDLGCLDALEHTAELARENGAARQRRLAGDGADLGPLVRALADAFVAPATVG
jgi:glutamate---cysteine ligase / carboxylate-amine ligase